MDYLEARDARDLAGLRLALTYKIPNPYGEAAKAIFKLKGLPFVAVAQHSTQPNEDLMAWTGHRNAPVAIWNDEPARAGWANDCVPTRRCCPPIASSGPWCSVSPTRSVARTATPGILAC